MCKKIIILTICILLIPISFLIANEIEDDDKVSINEIQKEIIQTNAGMSKEPLINSKSAVVIDRESKRILFGKCENERRPMASTTKIMTCIIAIENGDLNEFITVSKEAAMVGGSRLGLNEGDKITLRDLLYGLMLCSGNDAAVQIAQTIGENYEGFAKLMNKKAKALDLKDTNFVTPHGLDNDDHYTTAYELAIITDYALNNEIFAQIVSTKTKTITINGKARVINNSNELLGYLDGVNGVKTGFTGNAGRCLVASCKRGDRNYISVVLGADTKRFRTKDSIQILEYAYSNYDYLNIKDIILNEFNNWKANNSIISIKGKEEYINPILEDIKYDKYAIKIDEKASIKIECNQIINAPIYKNREIGVLHVYIDKNKILDIKIMVAQEVYKKEPIDYLTEFCKVFSPIY